MHLFCSRTAITNATIHSRPPSYRSHSSDHETTAPTTTTPRDSTEAAAVHPADRVVTQQPSANGTANLSSLRRPDLVNVVSVTSPPSSVSVTTATLEADPTGGSSTKSSPVKTAVMMTADDIPPPPLKAGGSSKKDSISSRKSNKKGINARHNLVTIVQTSRTDPVENGTVVSSSSAASSAAEESVIVTVSGSVDSEQSLRASPGEVEILAHL